VLLQDVPAGDSAPRPTEYHQWLAIDVVKMELTMMEDQQAIRAVVVSRTPASQRGDAAFAISRRRYDESARCRFFRLS
jgi:hypothetical protein